MGETRIQLATVQNERASQSAEGLRDSQARLADVIPRLTTARQNLAATVDRGMEAIRSAPERAGRRVQELANVAERLGERYALREVVYLVKPIFSRLTPERQMEQLRRCDAVLTALAD